MGTDMTVLLSKYPLLQILRAVLDALSLYGGTEQVIATTAGAK